MKTSLAGCLLCYVFTLANAMCSGDYSELHGRFYSVVMSCILQINTALMKIHPNLTVLTEIFFELSGNLKQIYEA